MHIHGSPYTPDMLIEVAATQALLQALPLGICTVDAAGRMLSLNTEAERLLGWSKTPCAGMALHDVLACWLVIPDTPRSPVQLGRYYPLVGQYGLPVQLFAAVMAPPFPSNIRVCRFRQWGTPWPWSASATSGISSRQSKSSRG